MYAFIFSPNLSFSHKNYMTIRNKLRTILPSCLIPELTPNSDPKNQASIHSSCSRLTLSDFSSSSSFSVSDLSDSFVRWNLHIFSLAELNVITRKFSSSNFLGEGGFGPVYKGFIDDKIMLGLDSQEVAVKLMDLSGSQGHMEWLAEVLFLGQLKHPHLVNLVGFCCEEEHRVLVYEYMTRGNLENQLFRKYGTPISWSTRIKIAIGAAKGLAFLHGEEKPVIYRDLKASNILLDDDYNAKLSDFGLATDDPEGDEAPHVTTRVMGTKGYAAPDYIKTGHLSTRSDVYSFGVVLLELITGRRSIDENRRPRKEQKLVEWAMPFLNNPQKLDHIIDPRLEDDYSVQGLKVAASLAQQCLSHQAKSRPMMSNVIEILEPLMNLDDFASKPFVYIVPHEK